MFQKIARTNYPPSYKPLMVWDGRCGFCHYWVIRWKMATDDKIDYAPYQEAAGLFPDIPRDRFKEAVRLIDIDGRVYNGPEAAFRSYFIGDKMLWLERLYRENRIFRNISDHGYQWISNHRPFMYNLTISMFGKNPAKLKYYWLGYAAIFLIVFVSISWILM